MPEERMKDLALFSMVCSEVNDTSRKGSTVNDTVKSILKMEDSRLENQLKISGSAYLLGFTAIVCNGDVTSMVRTMHAALTWWEEWFLAYELIWGRSWVNQCDLAKEYHINPTKKNEIVDNKLEKILTCRNSFPRYCSHEEDVSLQTDKWVGVIDKAERIIEHDTTNVRMMFKPSLSSSQKITYSKYYGGPSAKGDVELQICGWMNANHMQRGVGINQSFNQCLEKRERDSLEMRLYDQLHVHRFDQEMNEQYERPRWLDFYEKD